MVHWMRYQIFAPLVLLQLLNLFWYHLMWKILIRSVDILSHVLVTPLNFVQSRKDP